MFIVSIKCIAYHRDSMRLPHVAYYGTKCDLRTAISAQ